MKNNLKTIVCLGDSITCNWNEKTYTDYLQDLIDQDNLRYRIVNSGINGETAQDGYYRLDRDVVDHGPDLVTVMFGHNDLHWGFTPEQYAKYLNKIISYIYQTTKAKVWLLSPNKTGDKRHRDLYPPFLEIVKITAKENNAHFVDIWNSFSDKDLDSTYTLKALWSDTGIDYIHPNQKGHKLIAKILNKELNKHK